MESWEAGNEAYSLVNTGFGDTPKALVSSVDFDLGEEEGCLSCQQPVALTATATAGRGSPWRLYGITSLEKQQTAGVRIPRTWAEGQELCFQVCKRGNIYFCLPQEDETQHTRD